LFIDAEGLLSKKLEEIAYQSSDKVYGKEDTGPYECLRLVDFIYYCSSIHIFGLGHDLLTFAPLSCKKKLMV